MYEWGRGDGEMVERRREGRGELIGNIHYFVMLIRTNYCMKKGGKEDTHWCMI